MYVPSERWSRKPADRSGPSDSFWWCISLGHNTVAVSVDACKSRLCTGHASLGCTPRFLSGHLYPPGRHVSSDNMATNGWLSGLPICVVDSLFYAFIVATIFPDFYMQGMAIWQGFCWYRLPKEKLTMAIRLYADFLKHPSYVCDL